MNRDLATGTAIEDNVRPKTTFTWNPGVWASVCLSWMSFCTLMPDRSSDAAAKPT